MYIMGEFVYLDDPERDYFARSEHKYLITQNQYLTQAVAASAISATVDLHFNHPTKELLVMGRSTAATTAKTWFDFTGSQSGQYDDHLFLSMGLTLNGNDRVKARDPLYFHAIQNQQHHTRIPSKHIYCYSFALAPEQAGPTGSLNLSRIENTRLVFTFTSAAAGELIIIARNFNV
jgi:hypothetical protein